MTHLGSRVVWASNNWSQKPKGDCAEKCYGFVVLLGHGDRFWRDAPCFNPASTNYVEQLLAEVPQKRSKGAE